MSNESRGKYTDANVRRPRETYAEAVRKGKPHPPRYERSNQNNLEIGSNDHDKSHDDTPGIIIKTLNESVNRLEKMVKEKAEKINRLFAILEQIFIP